MSIATEVRAALTKQRGIGIADILEECSGDVMTNHLGTVLKQMLDRGEVTRQGTPGTYTYELVPDYTSGRSTSSTPHKATKPAIERAETAPAAPKKSQRKTAKVQRKTAVSVPARIEPDDNHVVALQADGSVFLLDKADGSYQSLPPAVVQQIVQLASVRVAP
jgi:hypothetical protein